MLDDNDLRLEREDTDLGLINVSQTIVLSSNYNDAAAELIRHFMPRLQFNGKIFILAGREISRQSMKWVLYRRLNICSVRKRDKVSPYYPNIAKVGAMLRALSMAAHQGDDRHRVRP